MAFWNRKKAQPEPSKTHAPKQVVRVIRAGYDAAATTENNAEHWAQADALSADAAASPDVRRKLVTRSRYEIKNNSYARGLVSTLVNDCIGGGPTLQVTTDDDETDLRLKRAVMDWMTETHFAQMLRTVCGSEIEAGEVLCVAQFNPMLRSPVKLTFKAVECDRLTTPNMGWTIDSPTHCDGIDYDDYGNPTVYNILKAHPGDTYGAAARESTPVPAKLVYHLFKPTRPEQRRGVPELSSALPLFAYLRRLTLATVQAAESIADVAIAITTDVAAGGTTTVSPDIAGDNPHGEAAAAGYQVGEQFPLERGVATVLAPGQKIEQPKPSQPSEGYPSFKDALVQEIARCVDVPFGIAAMDDSKANMSSAYLTRQGYSHAQEIRRARIVALIEWAVALWIDYAGALPEFDGLRDVDFAHNHNWLWPSLGHHADPAKTANGQAVKLKNGLTDIATEAAKEGREISKVLANQAKALGISVPQVQALIVQQIYAPASGTPVPTPSADTTNQDPSPENRNEAVPTDAD